MTAAEATKLLDQFDWAKYDAAMKGPYADVAGKVLDMSGAIGASVAGGIWDNDDPFVQRELTTYVGDRITSISGTTKDMVVDLIRTSLADNAGLTPEQLGDAIKAAFAGMADWRADTIARTEVATVNNIGNLLGYGQAGVKEVDVSDGDQDEECAAADGATWTLEDALANPLAHPNCERDFAPVVPERDAAPPLEPQFDDDAIRFYGEKHAQTLYEIGSKYYDKLDRVAATAFREYTGQAYQDYNYFMRSGGDIRPSSALPIITDVDVLKTRTSALVKAIDEAPPIPKTTVWRGLYARSPNVKEKLAAIIEGKAGTIFTMDGFQSASLDPALSFIQGADTILEVVTERGVYVEPFSRNTGERELLMNHGDRYVVIGKKTVKLDVTGFHTSGRDREVVQVVNIGKAGAEKAAKGKSTTAAPETKVHTPNLSKFEQDGASVRIL